jgi:tRNA (cmo5U34)-methyltransferase
VASVDWNPDRYLEQMLEEVPGWAELQEQVAEATAGRVVRDALELGVGTGESALRVLAVHPDARWTGIDASAPMLERARERLPEADLRLGLLEDPLPRGPYDLVLSVLVVHHLDGPGKRSLFGRVAGVLRPDGRFVLGDLIVPERPEDVRTEVDGTVDVPDRLDDQLAWLREAGLDPEPVWVNRDLAVICAERRS